MYSRIQNQETTPPTHTHTVDHNHCIPLLSCSTHIIHTLSQHTFRTCFTTTVADRNLYCVCVCVRAWLRQFLGIVLLHSGEMLRAAGGWRGECVFIVFSSRLWGLRWQAHTHTVMRAATLKGGQSLYVDEGLDVNLLPPTTVITHPVLYNTASLETALDQHQTLIVSLWDQISFNVHSSGLWPVYQWFVSHLFIESWAHREEHCH